MNKKTLVIGASLKTERYSNRAIRELVTNKITVFALGLKPGSVGEVSIEIKKIDYKNIHTVTLYLNPKRQCEFYDYIISLNPKRVIFNPGTENFEFYKILTARKIFFEEACTLVLLSTNQY